MSRFPTDPQPCSRPDGQGTPICDAPPAPAATAMSDDAMADTGEPPIKVDDALDLSVSMLVRCLSDGSMNASSLSSERRRECVAYLSNEGFAVPEMAQLMRVCQRTIIRDRAFLREENALSPTLSLGDELFGEFQQLAQASIQRLTRVARSQQAGQYERIWAEEAIVRIHKQLIDVISKHGYIRGGQQRLKHLEKTDPQRAQQEKREMDAELDHERRRQANDEKKLKIWLGQE